MRRAPLIWPIAFAVLSVLAVIIVPLGPGVEQSGSAVVEHLIAHSGAVRLRALLAALALLSFVVVVGYARERMDGPAGHVFLVGAAVFVAGVVVQLMLTAGLALHASSLDPPTARTLADVAAMWGPMLSVAGIMLAGPVIWAARLGRFPQWLATVAAVFAVEQVVGMLTIIGPVGSFIAPGGPMTDFVGGGLFLAFLCALGFGTALPAETGGVAQLEPKPEPQPEPEPESSTVSVTRSDIRPDTSDALTD
jgi:hypothetical protein